MIRVTVLGSGTSHGVPVIGCDCDGLPVDRSARPADAAVDPDRDRSRARGRAVPRRSPARVRSILVDTSTDLRAQALANDVRRVDAILFTHSHADHVFGLDEVRRFNQMQKAAIPCFADARHAWPACAGCSPTSSSRRSRRAAACRSWRCSGSPAPFSLGGVEIVPVPLLHGARPILGFRIGIVRLPDRLQPHSRRVVGRCSTACARWSSTRCATGRTRRTSASARRSRSPRGSAPSAPTSRTSATIWPRRDLRDAARRR